MPEKLKLLAFELIAVPFDSLTTLNMASFMIFRDSEYLFILLKLVFLEIFKIEGLIFFPPDAILAVITAN